MKKQIAIIVALLHIFLLSKSQDIPRPEHPQPQFERRNWMNLNGVWDFTMQTNVENPDENWKVIPPFERKILVPFAPESSLSGIGYKDFIMGVWYKRSFKIPDSWRNQRIFIHFGGVDFDSRVWINNIMAGRHIGGTGSFEFEITQSLKESKNEVVVYAYDNVLSTSQPLGKQSAEHIPWGIQYTRTTGIWQTVWLEARPLQYIKEAFIIPNLDQGAFSIIPTFSQAAAGDTFEAIVTTPEGKKLTTVRGTAANGFPLMVKIPGPHPWSPADPYLYNFELIYRTKSGFQDNVKSYSGLRKFHIEGNKLYLNNKPIFLRMVLDQGFYPDGIWTAPTDSALKNDIQLSMAAGFNSARLHQKVFEARFHYWADKLGYLTWAEFADWGGFRNFRDREGLLIMKNEWREAILRDRNHPSILAWTPFNETGRAATTDLEFYRYVINSFYELTHALDPTRPVNTTSGYVNVITDIFTVHDYDQSAESFKERYASLDPEFPEKAYVEHKIAVPYKGQPYVIDEFEGTYWLPSYTNEKFPENEKRIPRIPRVTIGYGKTEDDMIALIKSLTDVLLENPNISGFTFCQLTDVENEVNGVYYYNRRPKYDIKKIHDIISAPAAAEDVIKNK